MKPITFFRFYLFAFVSPYLKESEYFSASTAHSVLSGPKVISSWNSLFPLLNRTSAEPTGVPVPKTDSFGRVALESGAQTRNGSDLGQNRSGMVQNESNVFVNGSRMGDNGAVRIENGPIMSEDDLKMIKNSQKMTENSQKMTENSQKIKENNTKMTENNTEMTENNAKIIIPGTKTSPQFTQAADVLSTRNDWKDEVPPIYRYLFPSQLMNAVLKVAAVTSSILLQLTPAPTILQIARQKSTGPLPPLTYAMLAISSLLWLIYGFMRHDVVIIMPNLSGSLVGGGYLYVYVLYCFDKVQQAQLKLYAKSFTLILLTLAIANSFGSSLSLVGIVAACSNVMSYGAPLSSLGRVLRDKCSSSMPAEISVGNFLSSVFWLSYGCAVVDRYIVVTSLMGVLVGGLQVALLVRYPPRKQGVLEPILSPSDFPQAKDTTHFRHNRLPDINQQQDNVNYNVPTIVNPAKIYSNYVPHTHNFPENDGNTPNNNTSKNNTSQNNNTAKNSTPNYTKNYTPVQDKLDPCAKKNVHNNNVENKNNIVEKKNNNVHTNINQTNNEDHLEKNKIMATNFKGDKNLGHLMIGSITDITGEGLPTHAALLKAVYGIEDISDLTLQRDLSVSDFP